MNRSKTLSRRNFTILAAAVALCGVPVVSSAQDDLVKNVSTGQHGDYQYGDQIKVVLTFAKAPPSGMSFDATFGLPSGEKFTVSGPAQGSATVVQLSGAVSTVTAGTYKLMQITFSVNGVLGTQLTLPTDHLPQIIVSRPDLKLQSVTTSP